MIEPANEPQGPDDDDLPQAEATINLLGTGEGIDMHILAADGTELLPAVHFANWIGQNAQALMLLWRPLYQEAVEQHKREHREAKVLLEPPPKTLLGPDGSPLQ